MCLEKAHSYSALTLYKIYSILALCLQNVLKPDPIFVCDAKEQSSYSYLFFAKILIVWIRFISLVRQKSLLLAASKLQALKQNNFWWLTFGVWE